MSGVDRAGDIQPPARLGVVGGGQLGRMFVHAAQRMGFRAVVLANHRNEPAAQCADEVIVAPFDDLAALRKFAQRVAAVTVEFENIPAAILRYLARRIPVRPGWRSAWIAQHRVREKRFVAECGAPVAPWRSVGSLVELEGAVASLGLPIILKTVAEGYDGKGQTRIDEGDSLGDAWGSIGRGPSIAESVIPFVAEISTILARAVDGQIVVYRPFLNLHVDHRLDSTAFPAPVGPRLSDEASQLAIAIANRLEHVGVLTIEYFLTPENTLLVNEIAPRPHNSGHLTMEATSTSQFEQQVRALAGLPLGAPDLVAPAAMVNIMGELWNTGEPLWRRALESDSAAKIHLYGKSQARPGRKMGHITVVDRDALDARARALAVRDRLTFR